MLHDLVSASLSMSDAVEQNMKMEGCAHACVFCFIDDAPEQNVRL